MLNKLARFFDRHLLISDDRSPALSVEQKQLAQAALLVEIAKADHELDASEAQLLIERLKSLFQLSTDAATALSERAYAEVKEATSLHQFTRIVNQNCSVNEKFQLVVDLWTMAYADNSLNKYEEHLIRRVADLLYVSHSDFIKAKQIALKAR